MVLILIGVLGAGWWRINFQQNNKASLRDEMVVDTKMMNEEEKKEKVAMYVNYKSDYLKQYANKDKLLFFHAAWCPTCKAAETEITKNIGELPQDLVIVKVDYDTQKELVNKYKITYQHTFVLVDSQGEQIKQWSGGGVKTINQQLEG